MSIHQCRQNLHCIFAILQYISLYCCYFTIYFILSLPLFYDDKKTWQNKERYAWFDSNIDWNPFQMNLKQKIIIAWENLEQILVSIVVWLFKYIVIHRSIVFLSVYRCEKVLMISKVIHLVELDVTILVKVVLIGFI